MSHKSNYDIQYKIAEALFPNRFIRNNEAVISYFDHFLNNQTKPNISNSKVTTNTPVLPPIKTIKISNMSFKSNRAFLNNVAKLFGHDKSNDVVTKYFTEYFNKLINPIFQYHSLEDSSELNINNNIPVQILNTDGMHKKYRIVDKLIPQCANPLLNLVIKWKPLTHSTNIKILILCHYLSPKQCKSYPNYLLNDEYKTAAFAIISIIKFQVAKPFNIYEKCNICNKRKKKNTLLIFCFNCLINVCHVISSIIINVLMKIK
jgi:hypothetical protein